MDAVTGDQWNVEVREAAKECLDVIYSADAEPVGGAGMTGLGANAGMSSGYGNSGFGGGGYGAPMGGAAGSGVSGASKYEGIGNPMYKDPRLGGETSAPSLANMTVTEVVGNVGSAMMEMIKDPLARNAASQSANAGRPGYGGPNLRPDPVSFGFLVPVALKLSLLCLAVVL